MRAAARHEEPTHPGGGIRFRPRRREALEVPELTLSDRTAPTEE